MIQESFLEKHSPLIMILSLAVVDTAPTNPSLLDKDGRVAPDPLRGPTAASTLSVDDVDATAARAVECGATLLRPIKDEFYGERVAHIRDPFGHKWNLTRLIEHITPDEMKRRFDAMMAG